MQPQTSNLAGRWVAIDKHQRTTPEKGLFVDFVHLMILGFLFLGGFSNFFHAVSPYLETVYFADFFTFCFTF